MNRIKIQESKLENLLDDIRANRAIIDFDGVIVNSEPIHDLSYKYTLYKIGIDSAKFDFTKYIGNNEKTIWSKISQDYSINTPEKELFEIRNAFVRELILTQKPSKFIVPLLEYFKSRNGSILVSSGNGNTILEFLKKWELLSYFDETIMSFDLNKPIDKKNILKNKISESKGDIVVVEDSVSHTAESIENNAKTIWVKHSLNTNSVDKMKRMGVNIILEQ